MTQSRTFLTIAAALLTFSPVLRAEDAPEAPPAETADAKAPACCGGAAAKPACCDMDTAKRQTLCPIMGGKIDRSVYVDVDGYRIYVCCKACVDKVKADPKAAMAKIRENGQEPCRVPVVICGKCGEIKGSETCCNQEAPRCEKCGLIAGSPGCCSLPTKGEDALLCRHCRHVRGSAACVEACKKARGAKKDGCGKTSDAELKPCGDPASPDAE